MRLTNDNEIMALLGRTQRIAIVGLSSKPDRPSHIVAKALQGYGYQIVPVNPNENEVLGENAYESIDRLHPVDLVDVFRRPEYVPHIVDACIANRIGALWLQEGVIHEAAAQRASDAGIDVVMDRCMYKECRRLLG